MIRPTLVFALALFCFFPKSTSADIIFDEDFGNIGDGLDITTSNTDFTYRRIGSGGGNIVSTNPSNFTQAAMSLGGSTSTSLNGVGVTDGLGNHDFIGMSFNFRSADVSLGDLIITTGDGSSFTGNSGFNTSQLFFGVQFNNGNVEYRTGSWQDAGFTLSDNTDYKIEIYGNNTGGTVDYGGGTVAHERLDIIINGSTIADDVSFANNEVGDAFRIYQINGEQFYEIDDIMLIDEISAVPEPSTLGLLGAIAGCAYFVRRRRNANRRQENPEQSV